MLTGVYSEGLFGKHLCDMHLVESSTCQRRANWARYEGVAASPIVRRETELSIYLWHLASVI